MFTFIASTANDPAISPMPKPSADSGDTRPAGIGRDAVRPISASRSRSK